MIARIWRGATPEVKGEAYLEFLKKTGIQGYLSTEGNRGVQVLLRKVDGRAEFVLISYWDSLDAIRRFAGEDYEKAVYYPEDQDFLLEFAPGVEHYEVAVQL